MDVLSKVLLLNRFLAALNAEMNTMYDSLSHIIRLATTSEQILLPTEAESKLQILQDLTTNFTDLFIYGAIISQQKLHNIFENYKFIFHKELLKSN